MSDLPAPVLGYIHTLTIDNYSPAYLLVEKDGRLSDWGGKLAKYGVKDLQKGKYVGENVFFLEGLLPLDDSPMFLPCIKINNGFSADVHLFPGDEGDWVLLLDATLDEIQRSLIQQKGNDLSLWREKQSRIFKQQSTILNQQFSILNQQSSMLNQYLGNDAAENLAQKILSLEVRGERRDVTILFANLYGFTSYSENNPPDVVFRTLNLYLSTMVQSILDEGGMVDKIIGDAVMAFFGVLPSTEEAPTQAIKAALRLIASVRDVRMRQADNSSALNVGIGIASGSVSLGIIDSQDRRIFSAIGYPVNLATYLESQTCPGEILIDENTFNKIHSMQKHFSLTTLLGKQTIEPIRAYSYLVKS